MIITKLFGGLGNQMFQYAVGRRLSHVLGVELKLDISWFSSSDFRKYALDVFNIRQNLATPEEITAMTARKRGVLEYFFGRGQQKPGKIARTHILETHFHFDPNILQLPDNVYLEGYWQTEKYFKEIENIIRQDFTIRHPLCGDNMDLAEQIASCESVSIHVRRSDYVTNVYTNQVHGTCSSDYYHHCVGSISQHISKPHFFIFSDDPEWVHDNFKIQFPCAIVSHNREEKAYEDMRLISLCKNHIVANSTFSWWGAWLNPSESKIVYSPMQWFAYDDIIVTDLIPSHWIKR
jgi:hypothetical protein